MHTKLSHLTDKQYTELVELYYDSEKVFSVSQILESYGVDARPSEFSSLLEPVVHSIKCPYCAEVQLISKAPSRSGYSSQDPYCPGCDHKDSKYCDCSNCRVLRSEMKQRAEAENREVIYAHYGVENLKPTEINELDFEAALFLKVILTHKVSEDLLTFSPFATTQCDISPTYNLTISMLKKLMRFELVCPDPSSSLSAFDLDNYDGDSLSYYPNRVEWLLFPNLNDMEKRSYVSTIDDYIRYLEAEKNEGFRQAELKIWHAIIKAEAIEYYILKTSELGFNLPKLGQKTNAVFEDLANRFPLSQIYQIVYQAVKNTNHFATTKSIPKYQTQNMFIGGVEKTANRYEAEGWLKGYRRDFNCPQTTVSSVYFDWYCALGGSYFETKIPQIT